MTRGLLLLVAALLVAPAAYAQDPCTQDERAGNSSPSTACDARIDLEVRVLKASVPCRLQITSQVGSEQWDLDTEACMTQAHLSVCGQPSCY